MAWLVFALMTVVAWGLYGILLHSRRCTRGKRAYHACRSQLYELTPLLDWPLVICMV